MSQIAEEVPLHLTMRVRAQLFDALQATAYGLADLAAAGVRARVSGSAFTGGYQAADRIVYHLSAIIPEELSGSIRDRYAPSAFFVEGVIDENETVGLEAVADAVQAVIKDQLADEVIHVRADAETMAHLMAVAQEKGLTLDEVIAEIAIERGLDLTQDRGQSEAN